MDRPPFALLRRQLIELARQRLAQPPGNVQPVDGIAFAVPAARLLLGDDPTQFGPLADGFAHLVQLARRAPSAPPMLLDHEGRRDPIDHLVVLHLHLAAFNRLYERMPARWWSACEDSVLAAVAPAQWAGQFSDSAPPPDQVDLVLWQALCLLGQAQLLKRDVDIEIVDGVVHQVMAARQSAAGQEDGRALHAMANLALLRRSRPWARHVEQWAADLAASRDDWTTTRMWAIFALVWSPGTLAVAVPRIDQARHATLTTFDAMLLADAACAMEAFAGT